MILSGDAIFKDSSVNFTDEIIGCAIFCNYSINSGILRTGCFNNFSKNYNQISCGIFRDSSINYHNLTGNFILADNSKNSGTISGNVRYSRSSDTGILNGNISEYRQGYYSSGYFVNDTLDNTRNVTYPQLTLDSGLYYTFHQTQVLQASGGYSDYWYISGVRQFRQNTFPLSGQDINKWYMYNNNGSGFYAGLNATGYYTNGIFYVGDKITPNTSYYQNPIDNNSYLYIYRTNLVVEKFSGYRNSTYYIEGSSTSLTSYGDGSYGGGWYFNGSLLQEITNQNDYNSYFNGLADTWGSTNNGQYRASDRWYYNGSYVGNEQDYNNVANSKNGYYSDGYYESDQITATTAGVRKAVDNNLWYDYNANGESTGVAQMGIYKAADGKYRFFDGAGNGDFETKSYSGGYLQNQSAANASDFDAEVYYTFNGAGGYSIIQTALHYIENLVAWYYFSNGTSSIANGIIKLDGKWYEFSNGAKGLSPSGTYLAIDGFFYNFDGGGNGDLYTGNATLGYYVQGVLSTLDGNGNGFWNGIEYANGIPI